MLTLVLLLVLVLVRTNDGGAFPVHGLPFVFVLVRVIASISVGGPGAGVSAGVAPSLLVAINGAGDGGAGGVVADIDAAIVVDTYASQ